MLAGEQYFRSSPPDEMVMPEGEKKINYDTF